MRWPWSRSEDEKIDAARKIVEAERDLREARQELANVQARKDAVDRFAEAVQDALRGKGNGHATARR